MLIQQNKFCWISDRSMVAHLNYTDTLVLLATGPNSEVAIEITGKIRQRHIISICLWSLSCICCHFQANKIGESYCQGPHIYVKFEVCCLSETSKLVESVFEFWVKNKLHSFQLFPPCNPTGTDWPTSALLSEQKTDGDECATFCIICLSVMTALCAIL